MSRPVSPEICTTKYGIDLNCTIMTHRDNSSVAAYEDAGPGQFSPDPDIAGIGVLGAFVTVILFSILLAICNTVWWISKNVMGWKSRITHQEKEDKKWQISVSGFFEGLVLSCSDQQIFTGGAYYITLRYWKACSISAYHYNIIANMLLFTCATHLMAVTIAKHYWQHPYIALVRIGVTALVYIATGIILSNQGSGGHEFPSRVPRADEVESTIIMPAACFLTGKSGLSSDITDAFNSGNADTFFKGQIPGFTEYLVMSMFYILAVLVRIGRFIHRGTDHKGRRNSLYLVAGVGIAIWTVVGAFRYIYDLRYWVGSSQWIAKTKNGTNIEDDPGTFGQLVPLLLMALTVFTFLHLLAEKVSVRKKRIQMLEEMEGRQHGSSDTNGGKRTQVQADYFGQTPSLGMDKSKGVGFAVTEIDPYNQTPGASTITSSNGATSAIKHPPHLQSQSRSQTWASNITTGTTITQGSHHSQTQAQTGVAQRGQQQQEDLITPVPVSSTPSLPLYPSVSVSESPSETKMERVGTDLSTAVSTHTGGQPGKPGSGSCR